jgi:glycosyltransferase involved in cell wall biosynthesis
MAQLPVSVTIITLNEEKNLPRAIDSARWADEILVVDSFSTDGTLAIAQEYGARVIQHEYINSAKQKNWAVPQCRHEWVLEIDSDERMAEGAQAEIAAAIAKAPPQVQAFRMPRRNEVLGVWLQVENLYPDYQVRLFRRDSGRWEDKEVHAHVRVAGEVETLRCDILHEGMPHISKQLSNIDRYSRYQADQLRKRGKRFRWYHLVLRPFAIFGYYYVWKRGFTAGYRWFIHAMLSTTFDFWAHAKLWEMGELGLDASPR